MPIYAVTDKARQAYASPSISMEKGTYRMRAPSKRTTSSTNSAANSNPRHVRNLSAPTSTRVEKQMAFLVVLLICGTVVSFGIAYYLFSTSPRIRSTL
ncbi:hypothetical protein C8Q75DRAFT_472843 [Abortiporus biennis]|nr:hypothetical protein C8Q75DRAFT_472843 [Abortiporus biennis]